MRGELFMRGVVHGLLVMVLGVFLFAPPVSAAETVITARVMPVRHIVVNNDGVILRIVSNTSENVAPIVHLGSFEGAEVPLTGQVRTNYEHIVADLDMSRPADYVRKSDMQIALIQASRLALIPLRTISQLHITP